MTTPWLSFGGTYTNSEEAIRSLPRAALAPYGVRRLALELLVQAQTDLATDLSRHTHAYWHRAQSKGYRPDPESAAQWIARTHDRPAGFVWCCQVLQADPNAVRNRLQKRRNRSQIDADGGR